VGALLLKACAFRFFDTFLLIAPFYTVMFADRGLSPAQIGVALAAWSATGLALEIPSGVLADRVSRRWLLFTGQVVRAAGFVIWILVPTFWGFLGGLVLWGVKSAFMSGTFEALVFDELKAMGRSGDYARVIGRTQASRYAGVLLASLLAAAAAGLGYDALLLASVSAAVLSAATAVALPKAPKALAVAQTAYLVHLRRGVSHARRLPGVLPLLVFIAGMQAILLACEDYWQLFGKAVGLPAPQIALFVAALAAASATASILAHRMQALRMRTIYAVLTAAGLILVLASTTFQTWSTLLLIPFIGLCRAIEVNADSRFQHAIVAETRATVASVKGFATQCATTLLILGFGLLAQASAYRAAFLIYGVALSVLGGAYLLAGLVRSLPGRRPR
jgi:MFS family permease